MRVLGSAALPFPLPHYFIRSFYHSSLLGLILTFLRANVHRHRLLGGQGVESFLRQSRPATTAMPHLKVSFATDLLIRDFAEPEIANVFLLRTCEINPFSAHDADESSARWLSLGRTYLASAAAAMILES